MQPVVNRGVTSAETESNLHWAESGKREARKLRREGFVDLDLAATAGMNR